MANTISAQRRTVANDNDCLFSCFRYLVGDGSTSCHSLRTLCADAAEEDPDRAMKELLLGMTVDAYRSWISNKFNWGGENEILSLSKHFQVEVGVVNCESLSVLVYGTDSGFNQRIYVLYTGQHYDPIVGTNNTGPESDGTEIKILKSWAAAELAKFEAESIEIAKNEIEAKKKRMLERRVKRIKCGGCSAILQDSQAFEEHCMDETVEHDEDFCYECTEVEIVESVGDSVPEDRLDLSAESTFCFYRVSTEMFSNLYPAEITVNGIVFPSGDHCWHFNRFVTVNKPFAESLIEISDSDQLQVVANSRQQREDWTEEVKLTVLHLIVTAKIEQHSQIRNKLLETNDKTLAFVDMDPWSGIQAVGGISTGRNQLGKVWMEARNKLSTNP